ncbi:MAG TPA: hypothetical protein V6C52_00735 [Coleofasciculaceae cyanobacterium]
MWHCLFFFLLQGSISHCAIIGRASCLSAERMVCGCGSLHREIPEPKETPGKEEFMEEDLFLAAPAENGENSAKSQGKKRLPETELYSEYAVWLCENRQTRFKTRINGALAEILKKYPNDYRLRLLSIKEPCHEHIASIGE